MGGDGTPGLLQVWGFFFLLLGPIKILGPFHRMTAEAEPALRRSLAIRGFLFATCIVLLAGTMGVQTLRTYAVPPPVLALTGGLVLFLVALQGLLESFNPRPRAAPAEPPSLQAAAMPLAYPIIVTPSGIAAVIIYMTLAPGWPDKSAIVGLLLAVMLLNLLAMLFAATVLRWLGMPLLVLGTVLGVVQAALGLNIMLNALRVLGVIAAAPAAG
ncbi:MarC family protein [Dankookia sp. GCM10030260]|uniref:MarC family protein n=1 Tax=Dankookia sp. GCM10030260 TaxID=3273390 RepID=UPI00360A7FB3